MTSATRTRSQRGACSEPFTVYARSRRIQERARGHDDTTHLPTDLAARNRRHDGAAAARRHASGLRVRQGRSGGARRGERAAAGVPLLPERDRARVVAPGRDRARRANREAERVDESVRAVQGRADHPAQRLDAAGQRARRRHPDLADRVRLRPAGGQRRRRVGGPDRRPPRRAGDAAAVAGAVDQGRGILLELALAQQHLVVGAGSAAAARGGAARRLRPHLPAPRPAGRATAR